MRKVDQLNSRHRATLQIRAARRNNDAGAPRRFCSATFGSLQNLERLPERGSPLVREAQYSSGMWSNLAHFVAWFFALLGFGSQRSVRA